MQCLTSLPSLLTFCFSIVVTMFKCANQWYDYTKEGLIGYDIIHAITNIISSSELAPLR
jgi:hypothetical protein